MLKYNVLCFINTYILNNYTVDRERVKYRTF